MPSAVIRRFMPRSSAEVFALLHDYDRRLEWDTLLCEARLTQGHQRAEKGATSLCVGKPLGGRIGIETRYLTFEPGSHAAVTMINRPPFFATFSATIRHADVPGGSTLDYKLHFTARPGWLRWALQPVMLVVLKHETARRLDALAKFLGRATYPPLSP
jgi:hypothetical protein